MVWKAELVLLLNSWGLDFMKKLGTYEWKIAYLGLYEATICFVTRDYEMLPLAESMNLGYSVSLFCMAGQNY